MERTPLAVIVGDIRSAHNVGAIFRTADAFRLAEIALCGYSPDPNNSGVAKTALGAEHAVPWRRFATTSEAIDGLRASGYTILALEQTDASVELGSLSDPPSRVALVLGNEVEGVPADVLANCDGAVQIAQFGMKHSLNVSVAFGIAAWRLTSLLRNAG